MPFHYDIKIPAIESNETGQRFVFVKWLTAEKSYIKPGTALALVGSGPAHYKLLNAGEGLFIPWKVNEGDEILADQAIGRITTDGDLVPYGRPYFTLEPISPDRL
jgi:hypothetical protein